MAKVTVIIPFYQKEPGILLRALNSIFTQRFQDFEVLVIDDESPFSPHNDLAALTDEQRERVRVIAQKNAGPGGARNTGLNNIAPDCDYAAFLDSDDIWHIDHLFNAVQAMANFSADCYFASIEGGKDFYYHFHMRELLETENAHTLGQSPLVFELADPASVMLKNWSFLHLSTMVIGRSLFENIRFAAELRLAAEDVVFFCDCMLAAKRVLLCDAIGAHRGEGINIFHGVDSDSPQFLSQQFNTWVALDRLQKRFVSGSSEAKSIRDYKNTARKQALWSQARRVKRGKMPQINLLAQWVKHDPVILRSVMTLATAKLSR